MQAPSNTETARRFFEAIYAGDFDGAFSHHAHKDYRFAVGSADDAELRAAIPWAGHPHVGQSGYAELMEQLFSEFEPLPSKPEATSSPATRCLSKVTSGFGTELQGRSRIAIGSPALTSGMAVLPAANSTRTPMPWQRPDRSRVQGSGCGHELSTADDLP